jgi:hypothetical protein
MTPTIRLVSEGTARDLQQPQHPVTAATVTCAASKKMIAHTAIQRDRGELQEMAPTILSE